MNQFNIISNIQWKTALATKITIYFASSPDFSFEQYFMKFHILIAPTDIDTATTPFNSEG
jgi:hypothetical protein